MTSYTNISRWLKSGEYRSQLDSVLTKIVRDCDHSDSEAHTSSIFETEIYYLVRHQTGLELCFSKETPVEGIVHKFEGLSSRKSGRGRLDAVVNNVIVEYKHHTKFKTEKQITSAYEQVKDYLSALYSNEGVKYDAVLTDGIKVAYFQFVGDTIRYSSLRSMSVDDIDTFVLHQANVRIIESVANRLKVDISKFPMNLERVGNMSSATIPVLLDELNREGKIKAGDRLVLSGFGAGLTYGASVFVW